VASATRGPKPILEPGRPVALAAILRVAGERLDEVRSESAIRWRGGVDDALDLVAKTTLEALEMWLGRRAVPLKDGRRLDS
jgi:hypothetical protein